MINMEERKTAVRRRQTSTSAAALLDNLAVAASHVDSIIHKKPGEGFFYSSSRLYSP
jgi:hypothetical protein